MKKMHPLLSLRINIDSLTVVSVFLIKFERPLLHYQLLIRQLSLENLAEKARLPPLVGAIYFCHALKMDSNLISPLNRKDADSVQARSLQQSLLEGGNRDQRRGCARRSTTVMAM